MGLLDALRRARARPPRSPPPRLELAGRRVLLVYLFPGLGDALLLGPVVRALLDAGARAPVGLLLRESAARIWKHVDLDAQVHVLPESLFARPEPSDDASVGEALRLGVALARRGYAVAADLTARQDVDARRWLDRSKAPIRLGYAVDGDPSEGGALTWAAPDERVQALEHWTRYLAAPLEPLGLGRLPAEIPLSVPETARARAGALFGAEPAARVVLVPGARSADKRFRPETFVAAGRLARQRGASVAVVGGPSEAEVVKQVGRGVGAAGYAGRSLGPLVAAVLGADVVVTNDTGPMHLAFLSGRRVVALFRTMSVACWGPMRADPRHVALTVPPGLDRDVAPVVDRLLLEHLSAHLDALRGER